MKIAVTSQNLETVTGHAGHCRNFWLFEIDSCEVTRRHLIELPEGQTLHTTDHPGLDGMNVLITGGLGQHLRAHLKSRGIVAIATEETNPEHAVVHWLNDTLKELPPGISPGHCSRH